MKPVHILNGPNLNMLGVREPEIYGTTTLADIEAMCRDVDATLVFRQTNAEYQLLDWLHEARAEAAGVIINPAAWTFTSLALLDAIKMLGVPVIELHISNVHSRGPLYEKSLVSPVVTAVICGLGARGYVQALHAMHGLIGDGQGT